MATDHMHCMDAKALLAWLFRDMRKGFALGIPQKLFFRPDQRDPFRLERYGKTLETPVGAAAGPHTQMARNIIAAWLCGARYLELKTVQVLDSITVTKPCIEMADEGYNCEWSQELSLEASFREYLTAWVLIHVLHDHLGFSDSPGLQFNMSAGYSLEGIQSPPMRRFLDRMQNCREEIEALKAELESLYPRIRDLCIPSSITDNLTISCMHGCPPGEVKKIALYFLTERGLHTTLKLNPTLLGPARVRGLVNEVMGYDAEIPDLAFEHDLSYASTLDILKTCLDSAQKLGLRFGVKLTNTLETLNKSRLPSSEKMVYMSGKPLHPIAVALAAELQRDFGGSLDISFCAGADALNIADILACGLTPATVCSDLLKPGGYGRLAQYLANIRLAMTDASAVSLDEFIVKRAGGGSREEAIRRNLEDYAAALALPGSRYARSAVCARGVKTERRLPLLDCALAPCVSACPAGQNIPAYMESAANGDLDQALAVILDTNPFPSVLGRACNQECRNHCMRVHYDEPLRIRSVKGCAAAYGKASIKPGAFNGRRVAIAGAGPAGLSCAYFLTLAGCRVSVYESRDKPGGRIMNKLAREKDNVERDVRAVLDLGVELHLGTTISDKDAQRLAAEHDALYLAYGRNDSATAHDCGRHERIINIFRAGGSGTAALQLVESVGEGRRAATNIISFLSIIPGLSALPRPALDAAEICRKQAFRSGTAKGIRLDTPAAAATEAARCLQCGRYCGICVSVCPNRANLAVFSERRSWPLQEAMRVGESTHTHTLGVQTLSQPWQILNIGDFCNECGNCETFCPSSGAPYKDKPRLHLSETSFRADRNGILPLGNGKFAGKRENEPWALQLRPEGWFYEDARCAAILDPQTMAARRVELKGETTRISLGDAALAAILCDLTRTVMGE